MIGLSFLLLLGGLACSDADPPGLAPPADGASAPPMVAPTAPTEARAPRQRLLGEWALALDPVEQRQAEVLALALREPAPDAAALAAAGLSAEEEKLVRLMIAARASNPQDPRVAEMRAAAEGLRSATLQVREDRMIFQAGAVREELIYEILAEGEDGLELRSVALREPGREERARVRFEGRDALIIESGEAPGRAQRFVRAR